MDWIAAVLEIIALVVIGNRSKWGFAIMLGASVCWLSYVFTSGNCYGLLVVVPVAMCIHVRNFIKWSRKGKKDEA